MTSKKKPTVMKQPSATKTPGSLIERTMIVRLSIGRWYGKTTDKTATNELAKQKKARATMISLQKNLIDPKALLQINSATDRARLIHQTLTLPWTDGGFRILSSVAYFGYCEQLRKCQTEFEEAVESFLPQYDGWYEGAKGLLGDLLKKEDYPKSGEELRRRFYFSTRFYPMPSGADFRCDIPGADLVREQIEENIKVALTEAMRDPFRRLHSAVTHLIERLKEEKGFRDSTIDRIKELVKIIPLLNVTGDPALAKMAADVQARFAVNPEAIRTDKKVRTKTADDAADILKKLEQFI